MRRPLSVLTKKQDDKTQDQRELDALKTRTSKLEKRVRLLRRQVQVIRRAS